MLIWKIGLNNLKINKMKQTAATIKTKTMKQIIIVIIVWELLKHFLGKLWGKIINE